MTIWKDSSFYLQGRLEMMVRNAFQGLLLVFLVFPSFFVHPWQSGCYRFAHLIHGCFCHHGTGGGIHQSCLPICFYCVLGILVDDAIVVGESVYTLVQRERNPYRHPSWDPLGSHAGDLCDHYQYGRLCTHALSSRLAGKLMKDIPLVVIPALFFSLIESKFILPYHLSLCRFDKLPRTGYQSSKIRYPLDWRD